MTSHSHAHDATTQQNTHVRLGLSLFFTVGLVIAEGIAGYIANSLALLTDAVHNVTDVMALAITWYAFHLAEQPAHAKKTFGYHRVGILAALINASTLFLIAAMLLHEAYQRFFLPSPVDSPLLMEVGIIAFIVNLLTAWLIGHQHKHDLNLHSAFLHLMGDVFSTLGAFLAGLGIWLTGWSQLDPIASVFISFLIVWNAWTIVYETIDILLESTPRDIEMSVLVRDILQIEGVQGVHDLHVWSLAKNIRFLSAHILIEDMSVSQAALIQSGVNEMIHHRYHIRHATLQLECSGCEPDMLYCDLNQVHCHHVMEVEHNKQV